MRIPITSSKARWRVDDNAPPKMKIFNPMHNVTMKHGATLNERSFSRMMTKL